MISANSPEAGNLPIEIDSFIGRRRELREARRLLESSQMLTLVGPGGVGKTRLALRLAAEVRRTYPDGVWLAELTAVEDGSLVSQAVMTALGLRDDSSRPPMDTLSHFLVGKRLLLVLDNCEHLPDACAALAATLLSEAEGLRILATSRQILHVAGEQLLEVPPLSTPDGSTEFSDVVEHEAVRLFADRAATLIPDFSITADNCATVARLCQRLDGIPLAVELAAARLRALSPEQILDRLDDRYRLLTNGTIRTAFAHHQTLKAAIDWSYDLCSAAEQMLWARLSVFSGGFDLEAAEQTCADEQIAQEDVLELIAGLVDKSVLAREDHGRSVRYRLLETIRQYGGNRLDASGQKKRFQRKHRDYYHHVALRAEADFLTPRQTKWFSLLRPDLPNIRAALNFCLNEPGQTETGMSIASALLPYWQLYGIFGEPRRWLIQALRLDREPTIIRVKALTVAARLSLQQGDVGTGLSLRDEVVALARRLGDGRALAHALHVSGFAAWAQGDLDNAIMLLTEAMERSRTDGDDAYERLINTLFLAITTSLHNDARSARYCADFTSSVHDTIGSDYMMAWATYALGLHHWRRGSNREATPLLQKALRLHCTFYNPWGCIWCTEALAWSAADSGRFEHAARLLGVTHTILRSIGGIGGFQLFAGAHERCESQLRVALGDETFAMAVQRGSELGLDEAVTYALGEQPTAPGEDAPPGGGSVSALTPRERQVAALIAQGMSNRQIAAKLIISRRTAETHVGRVLTKLGFTSRTRLAVWLATGRSGHSESADDGVGQRNETPPNLPEDESTLLSHRESAPVAMAGPTLADTIRSRR